MRITHAMAPLLGLAFFISRPAAAQSPAAWHPQPTAITAALATQQLPPPLYQDQQLDRPNIQIDEEGPHHSEAVALMIVGAAGLVTGLIIDEDILTLAGAGVGLVGLYMYLR
jgi:hypothetical protein